MSAALPARSTLRREASTFKTSRRCSFAKAFTLARSTGSAAWVASSCLRLKYLRSLGSRAPNCSGIGSFLLEERGRTRTVTSTRSLAAVGRIARAPGTGARSLPTTGHYLPSGSCGLAQAGKSCSMIHKHKKDAEPELSKTGFNKSAREADLPVSWGRSPTCRQTSLHLRQVEQPTPRD